MPGHLTGYRVKYRQSSNAFTGDVFVSAGELNTLEYRGLLAYTQYCVQVLGETKYGSGPEYYDGCVNVTTAHEGGTKNCLYDKQNYKNYLQIVC